MRNHQSTESRRCPHCCGHEAEFRVRTVRESDTLRWEGSLTRKNTTTSCVQTLHKNSVKTREPKSIKPKRKTDKSSIRAEFHTLLSPQARGFCKDRDAEAASVERACSDSETRPRTAAGHLRPWCAQDVYKTTF